MAEIENKARSAELRQTAVRGGQDTFFTSAPCLREHVSPRLVSSGMCIACRDDPDRRKEATARSRAARETAKDVLPITQVGLKTLLSYCPETGHFTWKIARKRITIGKIAGCDTNHSGGKVTGRVLIAISGKTYQAHHLVWLWHHGALPSNDLVIDHRDGNPGNNRIQNLRRATQGQNLQNTPLRSDNTTGVKGVYWEKAHHCWLAKIHYDGKTLTIGRYDNKDDAIAARKAAEVQYHGEFAKK